MGRSVYTAVHRSTLLLTLAFFGCKAPASSAPTAPDTPVPPRLGPEVVRATPVPDDEVTPALSEFGGNRWGFVMATTGNRRFVFVRLFPGEPPESMGHHGGAALDTTLTLFDLQEGTERVLGEIIDLDDTRRFVLVTDESGATLLLDADQGTWETLPTSTQSDGNRCLAPRSVSLSPDGTSLGLITPDSRSVIVRQLPDGEAYTVDAPPDTVVWRAWPHDDNTRTTVALVPEGSTPTWPQQQTSCACRYCNPFAASYGMYGWAGPDFDLFELTPSDSPVATDQVPDRASTWLDTDSKCRLTPAETKRNLERGPWRWSGCSQQPLASVSGGCSPRAGSRHRPR